MAKRETTNLRIYLSSDGSEVCDEDFFNTLPAQTLFVVADSEQIITTDSDYEFEKLRLSLPLLNVADAVFNFMQRQPKMFFTMIKEYEESRALTRQNFLKHETFDKKETLLSFKSEHPEWFGQDERCLSKEEAMSRRAQDRVRGYYYKTKEALTRNSLYRHNRQAKKIVDSVLEKFQYLLIGCDYFSMIFNRKSTPKHQFIQNILSSKGDQIDANKRYPNKRLKQMVKECAVRNKILDEWSVSLCTNLGDFYCQGSYSEDGNPCKLEHSINPYTSRENFILFQVWNLDHQIELSRSILPGLIENVRELVLKPHLKCKIHGSFVVDISVLEYFLEIFSLKNLKLVHIVCHEKTQRLNKSNGGLICSDCEEYKIVKELIDVCSENKTAQL